MFRTKKIILFLVFICNSINGSEIIKRALQNSKNLSRYIQRLGILSDYKNSVSNNFKYYKYRNRQQTETKFNLQPILAIPFMITEEDEQRRERKLEEEIQRYQELFEEFFRSLNKLNLLLQEIEPSKIQIQHVLYNNEYNPPYYVKILDGIIFNIDGYFFELEPKPKFNEDIFIYKSNKCIFTIIYSAENKEKLLQILDAVKFRMEFITLCMPIIHAKKSYFRNFKNLCLKNNVNFQDIHWPIDENGNFTSSTPPLK